jgi:voltage-gated potassium channel
VERELFGKPLTAARAALLIAIVTTSLTVAAGFAVWLVDHEEFGNLGLSLWWAVQTVTTVGYGDIVPERTSGRLIGAVLMLNGIAFVTVITATVTAMFVEQARRRRPGSEEQMVAKLERIEARLAELDPGASPGERRPGDA